MTLAQTRRWVASAIVLAALLWAGSAHAGDDYQGTWWPDGMVCRIGMTPTCRYVAPGCELARVMDDQGELSGTRWVLFCRSPRGAV